jgi:hypothetical protein
MKCLGIRVALPGGRTECVPPRKPPFPPSPVWPRKAFSPSLGHFAEGRAPHARKGATGLTRGMSPLGRRPFAYASGRNAMPRLALGLTTRAHRVRPSEKSAFRIIPGSSPQGLSPRLGPFAEGRAPHARKDCLGFIRACPRRPTGLSSPHPVGMKWLGTSFAMP